LDKLGFRPSQPRQSPSAFTLDQSRQRFANKGRLLLKTGELLRLGDEFIVECEGGAQ
jgi:hypothetical protein